MKVVEAAALVEAFVVQRCVVSGVVDPKCPVVCVCSAVRVKKDSRFIVGTPWCPSSLPFEDGSRGGCRVRLFFHDFHYGGWDKANMMGAVAIVGALPE